MVETTIADLSPLLSTQVRHGIVEEGCPLLHLRRSVRDSGVLGALQAEVPTYISLLRYIRRGIVFAGCGRYMFG